MRRVAILLVVVAVASQSGCFVAGAAVDAGFRELLDDGHHPVYRHQSYGRHFVDALLEDDRPHAEVQVTVETRRRR